MCICMCSCCTFNFRMPGEAWPSINVIAWLFCESTNQSPLASDASVPLLAVRHLSVKTTWYGPNVYYVMAAMEQSVQTRTLWETLQIPVIIGTVWEGEGRGGEGKRGERDSKERGRRCLLTM